MALSRPMLDPCFRRILAVGAHPDDVELGCYGSLLRFRQAGCHVALAVLTAGERGGAVDERVRETRESARLLDAELHLGELPDTAVPEGHPTIGVLERVIASFRPTAVFVSSANDTHQDHRAAARATLSAARHVPLVLFYQTPSSTRLFNPTVYVDITATLDEKLRAIRVHRTQENRLYMADRAVRGLAEFLGLQIYRPDALFEGFEVHQAVF